MENKIDSRYFHSLLELPNLTVEAEINSPSGNEVSDNTTEINRYIQKFQKKLLVKLFGSEVIPTEVENLMIDEATLTSPIANYVFCNVMTKYQSRLTESGEKIHSAIDSVSISYKNKMDEAWNDMVEMLGEIRETIYNANLEDTYPTDYESEIYKLSYFI